jgi:hypothetical protein
VEAAVAVKTSPAVVAPVDILQAVLLAQQVLLLSPLELVELAE